MKADDLTYGVPDLKLNLFSVNGDHAGTKLDAYTKRDKAELINLRENTFFTPRLPIVRSWTGWKRLSVNCSSKHDLPTPGKILSNKFIVNVVKSYDHDCIIWPMTTASALNQ